MGIHSRVVFLVNSFLIRGIWRREGEAHPDYLDLLQEAGVGEDFLQRVFIHKGVQVPHVPVRKTDKVRRDRGEEKKRVDWEEDLQGVRVAFVGVSG